MFVAPNFTQTPNSLFDELIPSLKEGEMRVLLIIIRQTFGWHKDWDRIPLSQLTQKTGMEKKSVCRSLNSLLEKGIIKKSKIGEIGSEQVFYSLSVENKQENPVEIGQKIPKKQRKLETKSNKLYGCPKDTGGGVLKTPSKETPSKEKYLEKYTKEIEPPTPKGEVKFSSSEEAKELVRYVQEIVKKDNPRAIDLTPNQLSRQRKAAESLIFTLVKNNSASSKADALRVAKDVFLTCHRDEFWKAHVCSVTYLKDKWNKLSQLQDKKNAKALPEDNRKLADKFIKVNPKLYNENILNIGIDTKGNGHIEIKGQGNYMKTVCFNEYGFIDQVYSLCMKFGYEFNKVSEDAEFRIAMPQI